MWLFIEMMEEEVLNTKGSLTKFSETNLEAPGYQQTLEDCRRDPYVKPVKKAKKK